MASRCRRALIVAASSCVLLWAGSAGAQLQSFEVLFVEGDPAPGFPGATVIAPDVLALNESGHALVHVVLSAAASPTTTVLYHWNGAAMAVVVEGGVDLPGLPGFPVERLIPNLQRPVLSEGDDVFGEAEIDNAGFGVDQVLYHWSPTAGFSIVEREGDPNAPVDGSPGLVFQAGDEHATWQSGNEIYQWRPDGQGTRLMLQAGDLVDGVPLATAPILSATNRRGDLLAEQILVTTPRVGSSIVPTPQISPGYPGESAANFLSRNLNNQLGYGIVGQSVSPTFQEHVLWAIPPGAWANGVPLVRQSDPVPGEPAGTTWGDVFPPGAYGDSYMGDGGYVVSRWRMLSGGSQVGSALVIGNGIAPTRILKQSVAVPECGNLVLPNGRDAYVNARGDVLADVRVIAGDFGLCLFPFDGPPQPVVLPGDTLEVAPADVRTVRDVDLFSTDAPGRKMLTRGRQAAPTLLQFTDNTRAAIIFQMTPAPEKVPVLPPGAWLGLAVVLVLTGGAVLRGRAHR